MWVGYVLAMQTRGPQPYPSSEPHTFGRARRGPRSVWFGVAIGAISALVLVFAVWGAKSALLTDTKTFTSRCSNAKVTGTISVEPSAVVVQVTVLDEAVRNWTAKWGDYRGEVGTSTLTKFPGDYLLGTAQLLGDTDDGTHRTVFLRPEGQHSWCELKMHTSWLW